MNKQSGWLALGDLQVVHRASSLEQCKHLFLTLLQLELISSKVNSLDCATTKFVFTLKKYRNTTVHGKLRLSKLS